MQRSARLVLLEILKELVYDAAAGYKYLFVISASWFFGSTLMKEFYYNSDFKCILLNLLIIWGDKNAKILDSKRFSQERSCAA